MRITNQVFLQLREADRYACAKNPLLRRLAVVLLDNIVELQLSRKAGREFIWDRTTWYNGVRHHNHKLRRTVSRIHCDLLAFAKKQKWISEEDVYLLRYAHRVRNSFYHEGEYGALDAELAIRLLYYFVNRHFPQWRATQSVIEISPHKPIAIEAAIDDATGFCPLMLGCEEESEEESEDILADSRRLQSESYWKSALRRILTYRPSENIQTLIQRKTTQYLDRIEGRLQFIDENKDLDFNWIAEHRFGVLSPVFEQLLMERKRLAATGVLNIYLAVLDNEDKLLDIADPVERAQEFHKLLDTHTFVKKPLSPQKIAAYRKKADGILSVTEGCGIAAFLEMEDNLYSVNHALCELASDVDGHIQLMIDEARGK